MQGNGDGEGSAVSDVSCGKSVGRSSESGKKVWRHENLDTVLLRKSDILGIRASDENTTILKEDGLGMVETSDRSVCHDAHAVVDGLAWVVENGIQVRVDCETETCATLLSTVVDQVSSVRQSSDAGDDTLGGLVKESVSVQRKG